MRQKMDNWQRIDSVIRWANMTINYFALYIGLPRGENLYQIKKGNNGISRNLAYKIVTKFPEVSLAWLLTGEGQMFVDEKLCGVQIPFYQVDVESHITRLDELAPDREMVIPQLTGCDLAMLYNGKAMGCSIPSGSIVFLKKMTPEEIIPGLEYVIVCQKIITLRIVRTSERWLLRTGKISTIFSSRLPISSRYIRSWASWKLKSKIELCFQESWKER